MIYQIAGISFPYEETKALITEWKEEKGVIIQTMIGEKTKLQSCENCNGLGNVYLQLLRGNFESTPTTRYPITYFEGAWHIIEKTCGFPCPKCGGREKTTTPGSIPAQGRMDELTEKMNYTNI